YSSPVDYDVAFGLYTGTCGTLTEVACNDDIVQGQLRQAEINFHVQAGVTYILQVAEWNGGGPSGGGPTGGDLVLDVYDSLHPPAYVYQPLFKGPESGSVATGKVVSTDSLVIVPSFSRESDEEEVAAENEQPALLPTPADVMKPTGPAGSNLI